MISLKDLEVLYGITPSTTTLLGLTRSLRDANIPLGWKEGIEWAGGLFRIAFQLQDIGPASKDIEHVRAWHSYISLLLETANRLVKESGCHLHTPYAQLLHIYRAEGGDRQVLVTLTRGPTTGQDLNRKLGALASAGADTAVGLAEFADGVAIATHDTRTGEYALTPTGYVIAALVLQSNASAPIT
jgi:hypothetical protein